MKPRIKSKTYWFGLAVTVLGAIQLYLPEVEHLLAGWSGVVNMGVGVGIVILRELTKEPIV